MFIKIKFFYYILFVLIAGGTFYLCYVVLKTNEAPITESDKSSSVNESIVFPTHTTGQNYAPEINYSIKQGDSIALIAQNYQISSENILAVNQLSNPDILTAGTTLLIPEQDNAIQKTVLKYSIGLRDVKQTSIEKEVTSFIENFKTLSITQSTIIYNSNNLAAVENTTDKGKKKVYLFNYNGDWQAFAGEL